MPFTYFRFLGLCFASDELVQKFDEAHATGISFGAASVSDLARFQVFILDLYSDLAEEALCH